MLWAKPEAIMYSAINHQPARGVPTRNQRARHLNFVNATTTQTTHISARTVLTLMAPSIAQGAVTKGTAMPRTAMTRDTMNDDRKLLLSALTVVGVVFIWPHVSHRNQARQGYRWRRFFPMNWRKNPCLEPGF